MQPQTIQPLNMIAPDDHVEQTSTNQSDDNSVLNNLSSHLSGELPNVSVNLEKASEVASESPQQHAPKPQKTPSNPEQVTTTVLEQTSPEQSVPEQTGSDHISSPPHSENVVEYDGMITSEDFDEEIEQSSPMEIEQSASDQSSTSISQSIPSNSQPTNNL